jgi:hypothetical protein
MPKLRSLLWLLVFALSWPFIHVIVFYLQFKTLPADGLTTAWVFAPMGLLSGILLLRLLDKTTSRGRRWSAVVGYLLAFPLAFIGSLIFGLGAAAPIAVTLGGGIPLVLGAWAGFAFGARHE